MQQRPMSGNYLSRPRSDTLGDLLERVLDKGIVVAGDIVINLLDIELLTLKVRLLICSADTAQQMGIDWWRSDPFLTGRKDNPEIAEGGREEHPSRLPEAQVSRLQERIEALEAQLAGREREAG